MTQTRRKALKLAGAAALLIVGACTSTEKQESTGEYIDSAAISTKVRAKIIDDPELSLFDIDVETYKGTVLLSGFVETSEQVVRAETVARSVEGVKGVENKLVVK